jgi:hypothetical protein
MTIFFGSLGSLLKIFAIFVPVCRLPIGRVGGDNSIDFNFKRIWNEKINSKNHVISNRSQFFWM